MTQLYRPLLDKLGVTYPQYLVLLVLWENDEVPIKEISEKLFLETNTLTPLLKRMQGNGLIVRTRSKKDERIVTISLTQEGKLLKEEAEQVPVQLLEKLESLSISKEDIHQMKIILDKMLQAISEE
ncbi:MarR family transcriptional regulator [Flammeovirga sp. SubArs3]|uniref:MarR family winged helix-turn-helix transcriptional regulator n=1 Tax=Flammeovirga sp. SubArs3 TaxID=2995316 RepID=UPI00248AC130|nr:MarR family transcriptional regulator [Flammeovirga sp. SubArs3]